MPRGCAQRKSAQARKLRSPQSVEEARTITRPPADPTSAFVPLGDVDLDQILCEEVERVVAPDDTVSVDGFLKADRSCVKHNRPFHLSATAQGRTTTRYSITWSARPSTEGGMVRPNAFAVLRLITSSNFVGCSTGRSPGFAPLRILST